MAAPRVVDLHASGAYDESLLRQAHALLANTFGLEDMEPLSHWLNLVPPRDATSVHQVPEVHVIVAFPLEDQSVVGVCSFEYYHQARCGIWVYWAVAENVRGDGRGTALFESALHMFTAAHPDWKYVFAECHAADVEDPLMDPVARQRKFQRLGFRHLPVQYFLPSLHENCEPPRGYVQVVRSQHGPADPRDSIDTNTLSLYYNQLFAHGFPYSPDHCQEPLDRNLEQLKGLPALPLSSSPPWFLHRQPQP